jgi:membrane-associated phospholipid phosphatase
MAEEVQEKIEKKQEDIKQTVQEKVPAVSKKTFYQRVPVFKGILVLFFLGFALLASYIKIHPSFVLDLPITRAIQSFNPSWFDLLMRFMTQIGNAILGSTILLISALSLVLIKRYKEAGILILSTWGAAVLGGVLKILVQRPRPDPTLITQVGHFAKTDSFPSGHVLFFMGFYFKKSFTSCFINIFNSDWLF